MTPCILPAPAWGMWLGRWPVGVRLPTTTTIAGAPACGMPSLPFAPNAGSDRGLMFPLPLYNGSVCALLFSTPQFTVDSSMGLPHPPPPLRASSRQFAPLNSRCLLQFFSLNFRGPLYGLVYCTRPGPHRESVALYSTVNTHTHVCPCALLFQRVHLSLCGFRSAFSRLYWSLALSRPRSLSRVQTGLQNRGLSSPVPCLTSYFVYCHPRAWASHFLFLVGCFGAVYSSLCLQWHSLWLCPAFLLIKFFRWFFSLSAVAQESISFSC